MAILEINKPVETKTPALQVDGLKEGVYRFALRVFDDAGNVSKSDIISIQVQRGIRPILPVLQPVRVSRSRKRKN